MAKKQKEPKQSKGKAGGIYVVLMAVLIVVSMILACTVFFRVEYVAVDGNERYSVEQVQAAAGVEKGANLILTPGDQVAGRIYKTLPYVNEVKVKKRFPTTLKLTVIESKPVAVLSVAATVEVEAENGGTVETLAATGEQWIIDCRGKLLEKADETLARQYITVSGLYTLEPEVGQIAQVPVVNQSRLTGLLNLLQVLESEGMIEHITSIDCSMGTELSMVYDGRITAKMLTNTDFVRKIRIFEEIAALTGEGEYRTVNLKGDVVYDSPSS